jgi:hypothetical protein
VSAISILALIASPVFAQNLDRPRLDASGVHISRARAAALRECSIRARQIPEHFYQESDILIYRACMKSNKLLAAIASQPLVARTRPTKATLNYLCGALTVIAAFALGIKYEPSVKEFFQLVKMDNLRSAPFGHTAKPISHRTATPYCKPLNSRN